MSEIPTLVTIPSELLDIILYLAMFHEPKLEYDSFGFHYLHKFIFKSYRRVYIKWANYHIQKDFGFIPEIPIVFKLKGGIISYVKYSRTSIIIEILDDTSYINIANCRLNMGKLDRSRFSSVDYIKCILKLCKVSENSYSSDIAVVNYLNYYYTCDKLSSADIKKIIANDYNLDEIVKIHHDRNRYGLPIY